MASLYRRILRARDASDRAAPSGDEEIATISAEAKRKRILEEARIAVLERIRRAG